MDVKPLTKNAIEYTIRHILTVIGGDFIDVKILVKEDLTSASLLFNNKRVIFTISTIAEYKKLLEGAKPLNRINTYDEQGSIPIDLPYGIDFSVVTKENLVINADIISLSFIMLSRYEEIITQQRDKFDRFEYKNSIAFKYNFIDFPIVDEYALILQQDLIKFLPDKQFKNNRCKIVPTHDIDDVQKFKGVKKFLKNTLTNMRHLKISSIGREVLSYLSTYKNPVEDPYLKSIEDLIFLSKKLKLTSEFYFMGAEKSKFNDGYNPNAKFLKPILQKIIKNQMIIGLHGGFGTFRNIKVYNKEKAILEKALGSYVVYGRQHYLRFDINRTLKVMTDANIKYDSTLGYAEREGFRCGTCHSYYLYDFDNDCMLNICERPLIAMEVTLRDYRKFSIEEALKKLNDLFGRCKAVDGDFIFLWHNNEVVDNREWYEKVYCKFLEQSCE